MNGITVEVLNLQPAIRPLALAQASIRVTITSSCGTPVSWLINDISILPDKVGAGEVTFSFPRYKTAEHKGAPVILTSPAVRRAIEDVLLPAFRQWEAEVREQGAQDQQTPEQGGVR
jgi:hypothetical protein